MTTRSAQHGSALIGALFLIIVVAALGAYAMNLQANQQHEEKLQLLQQRVEFAARSGIEYWIFQIQNGAPCNTGPNLPELGNHQGLTQITLDTQCVEIPTGAGSTVYDVEVVASYGNFGDPDFVRRTERRTISI